MGRGGGGGGGGYLNQGNDQNTGILRGIQNVRILKLGGYP